MREIELKYDLADAAAWRQARDFLGDPLSISRQHNHFFDSPDLALSNKRLALRLRLVDEQPALVTLKGPAQEVGHAKSRMEIEVELDPVEATALLKDPDALLRAELAPLLELRRRLSVPCLFEWLAFYNERRSYAVAHPVEAQRRLSLELDRSTYADGGSDYELELELWPDASAAQVESADAWMRGVLKKAGLPIVPQKRSKLRRAIDRARQS